MSLGIAKRVCQLRTALENGVITLGRFHTRPLESVGYCPREITYSSLEDCGVVALGRSHTHPLEIMGLLP